MKRIEFFFRRLSVALVCAIGLAAVLLVWAIDRSFPDQVSLSIFYLIPVAFVAWFAGRRWAYVVSTVSAAAWLQNDLAILRTYPHWIVPYWNAFVRFGFFAVVSYLASLIARLRRLHDAEADTLRGAVAASQLKSRMISFVSHEFCNSLTTFNVALGLLRDSDPHPNEERKQWYEILDRVFVHLNSATSNFLNLERLKSGRFQPEFRRTLLQPLVHGVLSVLGPLHKNKNVVLRLDFPSEPIPVRADPDALALVFSNLIGNAFKFTPAGGTVAVRIASSRSRTGEAEISVEDTGIGISKLVQEHIFSDYYRAEGGKAMAKGYGVGLKVARELLDIQGVELKLKSEPHRGSQFSFRLPVFQENDELAIFGAR